MGLRAALWATLLVGQSPATAPQPPPAANPAPAPADRDAAAPGAAPTPGGEAPEEVPAPPPPLAGYPEFDENNETVIVGNDTEPGEARGMGDWRWTEAGVWLETPHKFGNNYFFPKHPSAFMGDGMLRATIRFGRRPDTTIMFRCRLPRNIERVSGYGLSVEPDAVRFYRWEKGLPRSLSAAVELPDLRDRVGVEVILVLAGPVMTALVYDLQTLSQIATVSASDRRFARGSVGVRAYKRQDAATKLTLMSIFRSSRARTDDPDAMVWPRVVRFPESDEPRLPEDLAERIVARENGEMIMRLGPAQYARAERAGLAPLSETDEVPWLYVDPEYNAARNSPEVPPVGVYKDSDLVERFLRSYHERFPELTHLEQIGATSKGRPIWAMKISDKASSDEPEPAVLLDGAHHGSELLSTELVLDTVRVLLESYEAEAPVRRWVDNFEIWVVPLVNPDGRDSFMHRSVLSGRKNLRDTDRDGQVHLREGVDLNRNYPFGWGALGEAGSRSWPMHYRYRGHQPSSEAESRAMMAFARREHFTAAISYHTSGTLILPPYAVRGVRNPRGDETRAVAEAMAAVLPVQPNGRRYKVKRRMYPVDGVWKDWLRHELGTVAMVVEGPLHNPKDPERRTLAIESTRPAWMGLLDRFLKGPAVSGQVFDHEGSPVAAEVRVIEIRPREGEKWTANPHDGYFARYLPQPGLYTVEVRARGFKTKRTLVQAEALRQGLDFSLEPTKMLTRTHDGSEQEGE